ncbi:MAG TPA: prohibitin family protein [Oculatellaceae cyanobacterium]|jgi:regulator of protease activity HflC (stomatin/prohibitin superfamily)
MKVMYALISAIAVGLIIIFASITTVNSGQVGIKSTFGVVVPAPLQPGLHLITPLISRVDRLSVQTVAIPEEFSSLTRDSQKMKVTATTTLRLNPKNASEAYANVGRSNQVITNTILQPALHAAVKQVISQYDMTYIIENQGEISKAIVDQLNNNLGQSSYVELLKVDVTGFVLDENVQQAIEQKQIAKQELERKQTELQTAKLEAQRLQSLQTSLTPQILMDKAIEKWDGHSLTAPTSNSSLNTFVQAQKEAKPDTTSK